VKVKVSGLFGARKIKIRANKYGTRRGEGGSRRFDQAFM